MSEADALHWGYTACDALRAGTPVPDAIALLENDAGFNNRHAGIVLGAAAAELCPDEYQIVLDWAHGQFAD